MSLRKRVSFFSIFKWFIVSSLFCTIGLSPLKAMAQQKTGTLLILGDSIATGYSLSGYDSLKNPKADTSWAYLLSKKYAAKKYNFAVDGDTTSDLLERIDAPYTQKIIGSVDVICLSIGGNNFLQAMSRYADDPASIVNMEADAEKVIREAAQDLDKVFAKIKKQAPQALVLVQTLYNPYQYWTIPFSGQKTWGEALGSFIDNYNSVLKEKAIASGYFCVDVAEKFKKEGKPNWLYASVDYTNLHNIFNFDPHPTVDGHRAIFETYISAAGMELAERLREMPEETITTTTTSETGQTTTEVSEILTMTTMLVQTGKTTVSTIPAQTSTELTTLASKTSFTTISTQQLTNSIQTQTEQTGNQDGAENKNKPVVWWHYLLWAIVGIGGICAIVLLVRVVIKNER